MQLADCRAFVCVTMVLRLTAAPGWVLLSQNAAPIGFVYHVSLFTSTDAYAKRPSFKPSLRSCKECAGIGPSARASNPIGARGEGAQRKLRKEDFRAAQLRLKLLRDRCSLQNSAISWGLGGREGRGEGAQIGALMRPLIWGLLGLPPPPSLPPSPHDYFQSSMLASLQHFVQGQNPVPPVNISIPTRIGSKMGGAQIPQHGVPLVLTHSLGAPPPRFAGRSPAFFSNPSVQRHGSNESRCPQNASLNLSWASLNERKSSCPMIYSVYLRYRYLVHENCGHPLRSELGVRLPFRAIP